MLLIRNKNRHEYVSADYKYMRGEAGFFLMFADILSYGLQSILQNMSGFKKNCVS